MTKALTAEHQERIRGQLAGYSGYWCPTCLPTLSVEAIPGRWRTIVDHSEGCESYAELLLRRELEKPLHAGLARERDDELMRELGYDRPPTPEELARWQRWADMTDAEFDAEEGINP